MCGVYIMVFASLRVQHFFCLREQVLTNFSLASNEHFRIIFSTMKNEHASTSKFISTLASEHTLVKLCELRAN